MDAVSTDTVKGYRLEGLIGQGTQGQVFAAHGSAGDSPVAVKVVEAPWVTHPAVRIGFAQLAEALMSLRHPHIVRVLDYEVAEARVCLVMERFDGRPLSEVLAEFRRRGRRVPLRQALAWLEAIGGALEYAHQRGLVHRQLHPGHVLVGDDFQPKVTDFGVDYLLTQASGEAVPGEVSAYLAPELRRGETGGPVSDVYSLARLFLALMASPEAPDERALARVRPRALRAVLERGLAEEPDARYPNPRAFMRDVFAATRGLMPQQAVGVSPRRASAPAQVARGAPSAAPRPTRDVQVGGTAVRSTARPKREWGQAVLVTLGGLALLAVLFFGAWRWAQSSRSEPTRPAALGVGAAVRVTVPGGRSVSVLRGCPTEFFQGVLGVATDGQSGQVLARRWCEDGWWYKVEIPALSDSDWGGVGWIEERYLSPK